MSAERLFKQYLFTEQMCSGGERVTPDEVFFEEAYPVILTNAGVPPQEWQALLAELSNEMREPLMDSKRQLKKGLKLMVVGTVLGVVVIGMFILFAAVPPLLLAKRRREEAMRRARAVLQRHEASLLQRNVTIRIVGSEDQGMTFDQHGHTIQQVPRLVIEVGGAQPQQQFYQQPAAPYNTASYQQPPNYAETAPLIAKK